MRQRGNLAELIAVRLLMGQDAGAETTLQTWQCPDGAYARAAIIDRSIETWPNYSAGPRVRVQQQHPETGNAAFSHPSTGCPRRRTDASHMIVTGM
jgi:hypothetical protein